jgi:hypothetical protein
VALVGVVQVVIPVGEPDDGLRLVRQWGYVSPHTEYLTRSPPGQVMSDATSPRVPAVARGRRRIASFTATRSTQLSRHGVGPMRCQRKCAFAIASMAASSAAACSPVTLRATATVLGPTD